MSNINGTRDQAVAELEMEMARRNKEWTELAKMFLAIGAENAELKVEVESLKERLRLKEKLRLQEKYKA